MERKKRNAIIFSLFTLVGLGGVGHFYLNNFKYGLLFLVSAIAIDSIGVILGIATLYYDMGAEQLLINMQMYGWSSKCIVFVISLIHIIYILRKTK